MSHILIIDDDKELVFLLKDILEMEGFTVSTAYDGKAGLDSISQSIDLILLDIMMPKLNGLETLKILRQQYSTPVLMLTAKGDEIDRVLGLELGADDYLPKPFSDRELLARIKAILRRSITSNTPTKAQTSDLISFLDIEINIGTQEIRCQSQIINLTSTEFILLKYLIEHPTIVISKEELSMEVLGKRLMPFDRSIDMHISNLRKKLPIRLDNKERIKTIRGRGYMLIDR